MGDQEIVTSQPGAPQPPSVAPAVAAGDVDMVEVRRMTKEDAEFVAGMTVESFRGKFEWAVGKSKIEATKRMQTRVHLAVAETNHNIFVAWYKGEKAGCVALKYHGDREETGGGTSALCQELGCKAACGLAMMEGVVGGESVPSGASYVDHICVDAAFRGKGIGKTLLDTADQEARKKGCKSLFLWVAQSNRAANLYNRHGYRIIQDEDGVCFTYCAVGLRKFYKMEKTL